MEVGTHSGSTTRRNSKASAVDDFGVVSTGICCGVSNTICHSIEHLLNYNIIC